MPPTLYLIDGHALAYRTYFALNPANSPENRWHTSTGEPTAGTFGFTSVLLRIFEQEKPEYLAVAFDSGKTFRHEIYPDYKGTRAKMPDDLRAQIDRIREIVDAFGIPRLEVEKYEADDILGTLARQAKEKGLGVKIITGDRDLLQLVDDRVIVSLPGSKLSDSKDYTPAEVLQMLGVRPDQVVDYKALVGDKSDNIPGVSGVGEKTAIQLLTAYDTLDGIYQHLAELPKGVQTRLVADKEKAYQSQLLARIVTDVPVVLDVEKARTGQFDTARIEELFRQLEFRTLASRLNNLIKKSFPEYPAQQLSLFGQEITEIGEKARESGIETRIVRDENSLSDLVKELKEVRQVALDTETTSTDPMRADLVGISLSVKEGIGYYIPVGHQASSSPQLNLKQITEALHGPLSDPAILKFGHNIKYDMIVLDRHGMPVSPVTFDTMIAEWLVNPDSRNLGLKNLAWYRLGIEMTHIEELIGQGKNQISMAEVPLEKAAPYAAADAERTLRLVPVMQAEVQKYNATRVMEEIELPLIPVLAAMEETGILLDVPSLKKMSVEMQTRLEELEKQVWEASGSTFNLNSTQQLSKVLFEKLGLEPPDRKKKTSSGHFSTSAEVLEELRGKHQVVDWILEYRELSKLKSTYLDALPQQINPQTGRVHTSYNQTGSVTGRLASSDPNLQNIPTRTENGRRVRQAFVAAPGNVLLSVDYSQIELRIVAHMANDEAMLAAFRAGQDIHATTAAAIYNVPLAEVTKDQRRRAKAINFGLIYGMGSYSLSRSTDLTLAEAENFVKTYFNQFPGVKKYLDGIRKKAAQDGYVETLLGRRRYFPGLANQTNANQRAREEREAINAPIQGTAADIMKLAMLKVAADLQAQHSQAKMLLQVHDELVLECPKTDLAETAARVQAAMESAYQLQIPLTTEARWGTNWGEMQGLGK